MATKQEYDITPLPIIDGPSSWDILSKYFYGNALKHELCFTLDT